MCLAECVSKAPSFCSVRPRSIINSLVALSVFIWIFDGIEVPAEITIFEGEKL